MYKIFERLCKKSQYVVTDDARIALINYFNQIYSNRNKNFGNGRDVRNIFENIVTNQSKRVARLLNPNDSEILTFKLEDLVGIVPNIDISTKNNLDLNIDNKNNNNNLDKNKNDNKTPEDVILEDKDIETDYKFEWDNLPNITFKDIAGLDQVKEIVKVKVLLPIQHPEIFEGYTQKNGGGLLLYGPPGTGKTMIAAAIANEIGAKFCSIKPSDLLNTGIGNSEKAVKSLFVEARQYPCSVIFFDEIDSITPKDTRSQYAKQLRSEFLAQLQGTEAYKGENKNILFLIAATNKPWNIDTAFLRPGRFGTKVYVGLPDDAARNYLIKHRLDKIQSNGVVKILEDIDINSIVERTNGFNCSDITNLLESVEEISALKFINSNEKSITNDDFNKALESISSSVSKDDIDKLLNWKKEND